MPPSTDDAERSARNAPVGGGRMPRPPAASPGIDLPDAHRAPFAHIAVILLYKVTAMWSRRLSHQNYSFFLFGPRATGKTTWLRQQYPQALAVNLLLDEDFMPLLADPGLLRRRVEALPADTWVVVDEIQRLPVLLNEVHELITRHGKRYRYALTGSSARKLRRLDANLLAGRVIEREMYPLVAVELGKDFSLERALARGTLPDVYAEPEHARDILGAYVNTYLRQEIQQEALVNDIGSFHRFLRVAALMHGQIVNVAGIARDAGIARTTVHRYFDVLVDTLIGCRLPAWRPREKVREQSRPKFYFFDPGVVRSLAATSDNPLSEIEAGPLLEGYVLHELRAATMYRNLGGEISYWRTQLGKEIDFVWQRGDLRVGIEVKAARRFRPADAKPLAEMIARGVLTRGLVVYRGAERLREGDIDVLPAEEFFAGLYEDLLPERSEA